MKRDLVRISKFLSRVLRHAPESVGLTLDAQGWVPVDELLAALDRNGTRIDASQLYAVVAGNEKQRFALRTGADGVLRIRANQGHSAHLPVDLGLPPVNPPESLFHGTSTEWVPAILRTGLRPGRRHHVHLSADVATALAVGRRRPGAVSVLTIRAARLADTGHTFYRSDNGVWLTASVPPEFIVAPAGGPVPAGGPAPAGREPSRGDRVTQQAVG